jgi:hypothetical protein
MTVSLAGFNPAIAALIQQNTLVRVFYDALFPRLLFRRDASPERWEANLGDVKIFTRTGSMPVDTKPLVPGTDPVASTYATEQWRVEANQYGKRIQTHMPTSRVEIASKFAQDTQKLGEGAGNTMNRLARNSLYTAYLSGDTMSILQANSGTSSVRVANINGFRDRILNGSIVPVSPAAPISVELGATNIANTVIAAVPDSLDDPNGPGTLTLGSALGANLLIRSRVRTLQRARILRVGGAATVDALTAGSVLTLNDLIQGIQYLRSQNVPPHADGQYHVHIPSEAVAQLMQDNAWQRIYQSIPDAVTHRNLAIGMAFASYFFDNNQCPNTLNVGLLTATGTNARESMEIGAEVVNENAIPIGRTIITGGGAQYEEYIPESEYTTEGGVTGKIGNFDVMNNGVQVLTDRVRFIIRSPMDVLQQIYDQAWSWSGDFAVPTDLLTGNGSRFKRAVVIEHVGI